MHFIVCPLRPLANAMPNGGFSTDDKLTRDCLKTYFVDEQQALNVAEDLAKKNPTMQFVVLSPMAVLETTTPQIIRKKITDDGELVVAT